MTDNAPRGIRDLLAQFFLYGPYARVPWRAPTSEFTTPADLEREDRHRRGTMAPWLQTQQQWGQTQDRLRQEDEFAQYIRDFHSRQRALQDQTRNVQFGNVWGSQSADGGLAALSEYLKDKPEGFY